MPRVITGNNSCCAADHSLALLLDVDLNCIWTSKQTGRFWMAAAASSSPASAHSASLVCSGNGPFDSLPEDAATEILQWVDAAALQRTVPLVSRSLGVLARSDRLWEAKCATEYGGLSFELALATH